MSTAKTMTRDRQQSYEVYDAEGRSVGRVVFPRARKIDRATKATVYLQRRPMPRSEGGPRAA